MSSDSDPTRTKILKATLNLLEAGKGKGVRMTDIAKAAGISRQAVYLHFESRADLFIETTLYMDRLKDTDARLAPSRAARTGIDRLDAFVDAWTSYIPEIYPMARAMLILKETDSEAEKAWSQRMEDMREGCEAAIDALARDKNLSGAMPPKQATDFLWTLLSIRNWEHLTQDCGWPQKRYRQHIKATARTLFVKTA